MIQADVSWSVKNELQRHHSNEKINEDGQIYSLLVFYHISNDILPSWNVGCIRYLFNITSDFNFSSSQNEEYKLTESNAKISYKQEYIEAKWEILSIIRKNILTFTSGIGDLTGTYGNEFQCFMLVRELLRDSRNLNNFC